MFVKNAIFISVLVLMLLASFFSFRHFYLDPLTKEVDFEFQESEKLFSVNLKQPIPKNYFLKNFEIEPKIQGSLSFEDKASGVFGWLGHKTVNLNIKDFDYDQNYRAKIFKKEFTFSFSSPRPRKIFFDEAKKELEISFFKPIEEDYFKEKFELKPRIAGEYIFSNKNQKVIFKPKKIVEDINYKVGILGKELAFKIDSPKTKELYFVGSKEEVVMTFTKKVNQDRFFDNFKITPSLNGNFVFYNLGAGAIFRPKSIEKDKHYKAEIFNKELFFVVESPEEEEEEEEDKKKEEQEKEVPKQKIQLTSGAKLIDINLSTQKMKTAQGDKAINEYLISSGAPGMPTPTGTFYIQTKEPNHWSTTYGLYMPYAMRIHGAYYIHELPYWPGGYREGEDHLGTPVSHGCVRLGIGSAKQVYNFANIGTKVLIHY